MPLQPRAEVGLLVIFKVGMPTLLLRGAAASGNTSNSAARTRRASFPRRGVVSSSLCLAMMVPSEAATVLLGRLAFRNFCAAPIVY